MAVVCFDLHVIDVRFRLPIFDLMDPKWLQWARQIQAIAQTGLHFASSEYDRERYQQPLTIAIQIFGEYSDTDVSTIRAIFDRERGYATPKVDVRGVVVTEQKILLVKERSDGLWTLPGGWADVNDSPSEAAEKEIREESGYIAKTDRLLALSPRHINAPANYWPPKRVGRLHAEGCAVDYALSLSS